MIPAKFGSKSFEVSAKKIYTPDGVSIAEELDIEETAVSGKKPTVKVKGVKLQSLSFELKLDTRFVDVVAELRFWKNALLGKTSQMFTLGKYTVGKFFLTKYEDTEIVINKDGEYVSARITLTFTEDGKYANSKKTVFASPEKASAVKTSAKTAISTIKKGTIIKPRSGARWYYTAEGALKKSGKSGKAYQKNLTVTYTYSKNGKIVCVNPQGLGWLKVEDVTLVGQSTSSSKSKPKNYNYSETKKGASGGTINKNNRVDMIR